MVELEYENVKISVPESWDDIKLGAYEAFHKAKPETHRQRVAQVALVCQIDPDLLLSWPTEVFNRIVGFVKFIFEDNTTPPSPEIEIDGVKYVVPIEDQLTLGAYVDADEVQKAGEGVLSGVLAIVCRPVGEAYDYQNNEARAAMFADLPVSKVLGVLAFFLQLKVASDTLTATFLKLQTLADLLPQNINSSLKIGVGIKLSRIWPILKYYVSTKLLRYQLRKLSRSYNTAAIRNAPKTPSVN